MKEAKNHAKCQADSRGISHGHTYLIIKDAAQAIEFHKKAFGATEVIDAFRAAGWEDRAR